MRAASRSWWVLALIASSATLAADVWRWTDAQGVVHYSDQPVPGAVRIKQTSTARNSGGSSQSTSASEQQPAFGSVAPEQARTVAAQRAVQADVTKKRSEQCKAATERYESLISSHRVFREDKPGQRTYLSAKELDEARVRAREDRDTLCTAQRS